MNPIILWHNTPFNWKTSKFKNSVAAVHIVYYMNTHYKECIVFNIPACRQGEQKRKGRQDEQGR
jgi:hypothetical protein